MMRAGAGQEEGGRQMISIITYEEQDFRDGTKISREANLDFSCVPQSVTGWHRGKISLSPKLMVNLGMCSLARVRRPSLIKCIWAIMLSRFKIIIGGPMM